MATKEVLASNSITSSQSLNLVKNMLRVAFSSVAYIRMLFDRKHFDKSKIGDTTIYKINDACVGNVARYRKWLNEGVFHALARKHLAVARIEIYKHPPRTRTRRGLRNANNKTQRLECSSENLLECYAFHVTYSGDDAHLQLSVNNDDDHHSRRVSVKEGCREMLSRLIQITHALEPLPALHIVSVKLLFTEDTPMEYRPPLFSKTEHDIWFVGDTIDVVAGEVTTPYHNLKMQVYARNTHKHREKLLPLTQDTHEGTAEEAQPQLAQESDELAQVVRVEDEAEEQCHASNVTPDNTPARRHQTVPNDSDGQIAAECKLHVDGTQQVDDESQRVSGSITLAAENVQRVQRADEGKTKASNERSAGVLPPLLSGVDLRKVTATQDSDFEATQIKRREKRKMSEVERYIVVRKRAKASSSRRRRR